MKPSELFRPDPEDFKQWIATEEARSRRTGKVFEELIREEPGEERLKEPSRGVFKGMSRLEVERSKEQIEIVKKALQTWESSDIDAALRVMHPNLAPA
jgi:hypothetical protein